jgi:hypothetical protein
MAISNCQLLHHYCAIHSQRGKVSLAAVHQSRAEVGNEGEKNWPHAAEQEKIYPMMIKKM